MPATRIPEHILAFPQNLRVRLWMAYGTALGLPVDDLVQSINLQLTAARRTLDGKRVRLSVTERLQHANLSGRLTDPFRALFQWIVSPESLIRWLKRYQERHANSGPPKNKKGRPWIGQDKVDAILRIYDSGLTGLKRIVGEMRKCGMPVAKSTVRRVLTRHGHPPPEDNCRRDSTWAQFWNRHAPQLVGADFIQIPIGLLGKVVKAFVFFAIEHDTRRVHLLGVTTNPADEWIANALRSVTMHGAPLADRKYWILDNDGKFGKQTAAVLGKRLIWTSIGAPDMNAFAERFIRGAREECLDHIVFLSERMLRHYALAHVLHHNTERPHQGIGNVPIADWRAGGGDIVCDERLDGLLKSFRRAA